MDPMSIVADEVALEGLDGITIPSLWIRLECRQPKFPLQLDDSTKELLWKTLINNTDLKFYQLPHEREDVVLFDRFADIDPETGIEITQSFTEPIKDVYPIHIVENKDGIQGSCAFFKQRTDVTKHVRSKSLTPLVNLQEALERYGRKLVVVASQMVRFRALIGIESDPDLTLNDNSYCVLERVGRARWQGELQKDLHGRSFKIDARKLHYMRKSLVKHGLVSMQSHCTRLSTGQQQHSILLLLKRFHVNRRSKYDILMEYVSDLLQQLPGQFTTMITLKAHLKVNDTTLKRALHYMRAAKLVELYQCPLEELDPSAGPCVNKKGNKVLVRCLRLLKPYTKKGMTDEDDDEYDDDEDYAEAGRALPPEGRIMEQDVLSQAYDIVSSCGTKGIPQSGIGFRMNVGKLEARMICRRLEKDGAIKGFMEDEGRQRTTKFINHACVGVSDKLQLFAKEQERNKLLCSSSPQTSSAAPLTPATPSTSNSAAIENRKSPAAAKKQNAGREGNVEEAHIEVEPADESLDRKGGKARRQSGAKGKTSGKKGAKQISPEIPIVQPTAAEACSKSTTSTPDLEPTTNEEQAPHEQEEDTTSGPVGPLPQSDELNMAAHPQDNNIVEVKVALQPKVPKRGKYKRPTERIHQTYRFLRRKNVIVEAVRNLKIIEGLFPLQKMINDYEKQDGLSTKCCKKTILRFIHSLSREGLLKLYTTTIIQDGITKKVELVVHPSIQPNDDIVRRVIEQIRFKISSSYTVVRQQHAEEKAREQGEMSEKMTSGMSKAPKSKADKLRASHYQDDDFKPVTVRGLGKKLGFLPKMPRLRVIHTFLWYLIYGHSQAHNSTDSHSRTQTPDKPNISDAADGSADPQSVDSTSSKLDMTFADEEEGQKVETKPDRSASDMKVYVDEDSWKRFMPPVNVHKEYGSGWAMVGDLLLCLPLSVFVQITQINYKVDELEEYLNDPVKQHLLVRALPARMRRQLLYKRKYIFIFHENLQKLVYMGLLQFGPVEKFKDKDQLFLYLKRNASIVDTTSAEPHYWLVTESLDKPFERRQYTFNTAEDVENFWFDLMCVCLNTPLGVIRSKRNPTEEIDPSFVHERNVFIGLAYMLKGSREVCDDGSIPGDGKGAGGLDSEFFGHLKRNWFWTSHLLSCKKDPTGSEAKENKIRLKSLLSKNALRFALKAGGSTTPRYVTAKRSLLTENIELNIEPASRNQRVVGGKGQKRKRSKKEVVKAPRKKKKEPQKRGPAHDEADHRALKMMTRRRVNWAIQEDSLMMLCRVASDLLNSKLKRPFIPYCVVRDLLHSEFEVSMDKTSVAVGRRTRYILKNPQTLLNYRISLAEVYQDKPLMKLLEENKPADPQNPEDCAKVFSEYVRLLRQKFSSTLSPCDMIMPNTKHQLFARFKVSAIQSMTTMPRSDSLSCTDDIHAIVLDNLIQSTLAMTNSQMKSSRAFQTFQLYSQYSQELLCKVFLRCRQRGLVNRRRVNPLSGPKKNRALPILPMSYQLSQSYYRSFSTRFPHSLCTDSFRLLKTLINNRTENDRPMTMFCHETENRSESGEEVVERRKGSERNKEKSKVKEDGRAVSEPEVILEKTNDGSTKEGENNQKKVEGEQKNAAECSTAVPEELPSAEQRDDNHSGAASSKAAERALEEPSEEPPDVSDMLPFTLDSPGGSCVVSLSLMSLGLLSVYISIPKQIVMVDSNLVDNNVAKSLAALEEEDDDEDDGEECEGRKKLEVKAHQASHTNYLMMRGYCSPGIVKQRELNTADNIVVESCIIKLQMRNKPAHLLLQENSPLDLTKCGPSLLPSCLTFSFPSSCSSPSTVKECEGRLIQQRGFTPQDIEACVQLRRSLDAAGEFGLDTSDLYRAHVHLEEPQSGRTRSLQQYVKDLQEDGQVVQVGSLGARWVLMQHAEPWLLTVYSKPLPQSHPTHASHNSSLMHKRTGHRPPQKTEEPPAKRYAVDQQEGEDVGSVSSEKPEEKLRKEDQKEREDEGSGEKPLSLEEEGGRHLQPDKEREEEAGKGTEETERGREMMEAVVREDSRDDEKQEACSPSTGPAGADVGNMTFVSRPWRMVDGSVNRPVCKGMLESVLYHIMSRPGITQQTLVEQFQAVLQPMALLDLVQALVEMGCVSKKTLVKVPKPSLFNHSAPQPSSETKPKVEDPDTVFYEPTISCCLRLSQVLPNERHWNHDL